MTQPAIEQSTNAPQPARKPSQPAEPVSRFRIPEESELPPELKQVWASVRSQYGFVPNWLRALSINPGSALRLIRFYEHLWDAANSQLTKQDRELIAVVASAVNHCSYCVFNHTQALGQALNDRVRAQRIALGHHHVPLNEREQALAEVTETLTREPTAVTPGELNKLRSLGFHEAAILEVLEIGAFFNYANRLTIALNVVPDAQFFA